MCSRTELRHVSLNRYRTAAHPTSTLWYSTHERTMNACYESGHMSCQQVRRSIVTQPKRNSQKCMEKAQTLMVSFFTQYLYEQACQTRTERGTNLTAR